MLCKEPQVISSFSLFLAKMPAGHGSRPPDRCHPNSIGAPTQPVEEGEGEPEGPGELGEAVDEERYGDRSGGRFGV